MSEILLVTVRLHDGRFHGMGEREPSPARLFQALVAGAARGGLNENDWEALEWLERLAPPIIGLPNFRTGQAVSLFVPNNDLDAVGGRPDQVGKIRVSKTVQPRIFDREIPLLYAWELGKPSEKALALATRVCSIAEKLYQFGRGVDLAWAKGEVLTRDEFNNRLAEYRGRVLRPSGQGGADDLPCPQPGSLASLEKRFKAMRTRLSPSKADPARQWLKQPPKPLFTHIVYDARVVRRVFELQSADPAGGLGSWPFTRTVELVTSTRDGVVKRLREVFPEEAGEIEAYIVGRKADGADAAPATARVRIIPLPSIGHEQADRRIRRVLVEIPAACPLLPDDVLWAFSGLEIHGLVLTPSWADLMLKHYRPGRKGDARLWRTVTPMALPESAARRRIEPARQSEEAKGGEERGREEVDAANAVRQALRHAGVRTRVESIRIQREPFEHRGERAEAFARDTRFKKERLWHVELTFAGAVEGPLLLGDGRFMGLGLMAPVREVTELHAFGIEEGLNENADPQGLARALRRAVMARVQAELPPRAKLPEYFSGHREDGKPATSGHLGYLFDPVGSRFLVVPPHVLERREPDRQERNNLKLLANALSGLDELRAGSAGLLRLRSVTVDRDSDPLFAPSKMWRSLTPYLVTRHTKRVGAAEALAIDIRRACGEIGLPTPRVATTDAQGVSDKGLIGLATLTFEVAVEGPILIGRSKHLGGGAFVAAAGTPKAT